MMVNHNYERVRRTQAARSQDWRCWHCGQPMSRKVGNHKNPMGVTTEHLVPKSRGGTSDRDNIVAACWRCNQKRGDNPIRKDGAA